jgi:alpha-amylase
MQSNAIHELYRLEKKIKRTNDEKIIADWRKLQVSDHFYYMCTKYFADGDVHKYFNPYDSPYDSYINFMNVLDHLQSRCSKRTVHDATNRLLGADSQSNNPTDLQTAN